METQITSFSLLALTAVLLSTCSSAADPTSFVYAGCSQGKYSPGTPYQYNLNSLLASAANGAAMSTYANFTSALASPTTPVYGLYQCRGDLGQGDCAMCVRAAVNQLSALCSSSLGAALQLRGCLVRYGNDSFLGQPDKTLLFKRCGSGGSTGSGQGLDTEMMGMREGVLSALLADGQGSYRVSKKGYVDGAAQCVGDLDPDQCKDCLTDAVNGLRTGCGGTAASGVVYFGKCYVEFSASTAGGGGREPYSTMGIGSGSGSSGASNSGHAKGSGKDVAIVLGIAVGLLAIILVAFFFRRSYGGKR